jgi:DNA-directed RNA polymerase subunit A'
MSEEIVSKQVRSIVFTMISPEQIKKIGVAKIVTPELYDMDGYPVDGGLMDLRLGAIDPGVRCRTCGGKLKECLGHFGFIELARPVIHIKYLSLIEMMLRSTCQECGKILIDNEDMKLLSMSQILKKAKDVKRCPHCKAEHDKIKLEKPSSFFSGKKRIFPNEIRERLVRVSNEDLNKMGINSDVARPEWALLTLLLVPPVTARPSITLDSGERSEDDLTHKLGDIVRSNQRLWENLNAGAPEVIIEDLWDLLQYHVTTYFDNSIAQVPPARHRSGQPLETITERIKGKEGRIRHNLAGKRVNFSSRTVISPDPNIGLNEVGVPPEIAETLTVPEIATSQNMERLKKLIMSASYPGANYVIRPDGKKKRITDELREEIIEELGIGYKVERHLQDGDIVLFNRHPSLHKLSLMSHFVRVLPGRTFRLHPGTAFPYNADYDGDEMNIHVPQTEEARAESKILMNVKEQLITPKNNSNVLGCITDAITGNYLLSIAKLPRDEAMQLLSEVGIEQEFKKEEIDGKEIFSAILPKKISFSNRTKTCKGSDCPYYDAKSKGEEGYRNCKKDKCPFNAYLSIENGKLLSGVVDDVTIGVEGGILIKEMDKVVGREVTFDVLQKIFSLGINYLAKTGFSISLNDVNLPKIKNSTSNIIDDTEKKVQEIISSYFNNTIILVPGKSKEETREIRILQALNDVRSKLGEIVKKELPSENPINVMIQSGAGGAILNITQMTCSVGQQSLWAKRIDIGYTNRTLPFFKRGELSPRSRGFIRSNYFEGLDADEFFFGAITGRDSLMDTALRTPKSGYLYRRLANTLQDMKVEYDGSVRDATGRIVQFIYGDDGSDVSKLHLHDKKIAPGEAIGIITAQSLGEPSTQMTLNVFHFAGVQEMQVTVGLPRLIELFDARKKPSTPAMEIHLEDAFDNEKEAKELTEKIKSIKLEDIASEIKLNFTEGNIEILLDKSALKDTHITAATVLKRLAEKEVNARIKDDYLIIKTKEESFREMYKLKEKIKKLMVTGVKNIDQVLLIKKDNHFIILTAGSNLKDILDVKGVDKNKTSTNNPHEVAEVLGIEAARQAIINETEKVIQKQGLDIDKRHISLIADAMTSTGSVKGITRIGIIHEKSSILAKASFETPIKHFINASIQGSKDELKSVIENVILNQPVPVGTGLPGLLVKVTGKLSKTKETKEKK